MTLSTNTISLIIAHACLVMNMFIIKDQSKKLGEHFGFEKILWNIETALWIVLVINDIILLFA